LALKVLLADSDRQWLATTKQELLNGGYVVDFVENGKEVQLKLYNEEFFSCIINFSIENYTLLQVLKFIKNNVRSSMTVVVVVDDDVPDEEVNESSLKKLGVAEIVKKGGGHPALLEALEGHLSLGDVVQNLPKRDGVSEEEEVSEEDSQFTSIIID
jgi:DNA-binding NtrC family response regulator